MKFLVSLFVVFFLGTAAYCEEPLKVGIVVDSPFVIKKESVYSGIAIDLWGEIAKGLQRSSTFIEYSYESGEKPFEALEKGEIDVLIGPLSVTAYRYQKADYTLPFFIDKVIALSPTGFTNYIYNAFLFIKMLFITISGILFIFIVLFLLYIHILWYYERDYPGVIPRGYKEGILYLFWSHVISRSMRHLPRSLGGKVVLLFQRATFYIIVIILNAVMISFMTVALSQFASPIQSLSDLEKRKVGAKNRSKPFKAGIYAGLRVIPFESLQEGVNALEKGEIQAFLEDSTVAEGYLTENPQVSVSTSAFELRQDPYAFATPIASPLIREINSQLLRLRILEIPQKICKGYLKSAKSCDL